MITTALPQIHGHDMLTHSRMACAKTCLRKHFYQYEMGMRKDRQSTPLRMGTVVHDGLDRMAQGEPVDDAIHLATSLYDDVPAWVQTDDDVHDWECERVVVAELMRGYANHYHTSEVAEYVATEMTFNMPLVDPGTNEPSRWCVAGKIDKIVRLADGRLAMVEHKTTGESIEPESDYWKRLSIDQQISLYYLAAHHVGYPVETVIYDVIRKPSIRPSQVPLLDDDGVKIVLDASGQRVRNGNGAWRQSADSKLGYALQSRAETPSEFGQRLADDIATRPEFYYARREIPRLNADLDEFAFELWQMAQILGDCKDHGRWPRNTAACIHPYRCEYTELCFYGYKPEDRVPPGFAIVPKLHPELGDE